MLSRITSLAFALLLAHGFSSAQVLTLLKDINPSGSSFPTSLVVFNNMVYFSADDGVHGAELWQSDGTAAGTKMAFDFSPGATASSPASLFVYQNSLYFIANKGTAKRQLWKSDGTLNGTIQLTSSSTDVADVLEMIGFNGEVFFSLNGELWATNGTQQGTRVLASGSIANGTGPEGYFIYKGNVYYTGNAEIDTRAIYRIDSNDDVLPIYTCGDGGCSGFSILNDKFYYAGGDSSLFNAPDIELYVSDGTATGTHMLTKINQNGNSNVSFVTMAGNQLYFQADDGSHGGELWASDGTAAGTRLVKDIRTGNTGSNPIYMTPYNNKVVFNAYPKNGLGEFWISDGTTAGTIMLDTIIPDISVPPFKYGVLNNRFYFNGNRHGVGYELCVTDGTPAGTKVLSDINPGIAASSPSYFAKLNGALFFDAVNVSTGNELYKLSGFYITLYSKPIANTINNFRNK